MKTSIASLALAALPLAVAKKCFQYSIPLTVTSANYVYTGPRFKNNFDLEAFVDNITSRSPPSGSDFYAHGLQNETAHYTIGATFCQPDAGQENGKQSTILVASHGLNFDQSYWDPAIDPERYSFVGHVTSLGYSILTYDRLGVGRSSLVSDYVSQLSNQIAILDQIVQKVRAGSYTGSVGCPSKLVLIGHSYGSALSLSIITQNPNAADAVILTGYSFNSIYMTRYDFLEAASLRIASTVNKTRFGKLDSGYLTSVDAYGSAVAFLHQGGYDPRVAFYADQTKAPISLGEMLTAGAIDLTGAAPSTGPLPFKGAALIITGKYDFIFCNSDCTDALDIPSARIFSNAKNYKSVVVANAGHGLNHHYAAKDSFIAITDFLAASGL